MSEKERNHIECVVLEGIIGGDSEVLWFLKVMWFILAKCLSIPAIEYGKGKKKAKKATTLHAAKTISEERIGSGIAVEG